MPALVAHGSRVLRLRGASSEVATTARDVVDCCCLMVVGFAIKLGFRGIEMGVNAATEVERMMMEEAAR